MKLNSKIVLIVIVVVLAIALGALFTTYSRQASEREELNRKLNTAQALLPGLMKQRQDLEDQLASAQYSLNASQAKFPTAVQSIEYDDDFFEIADGCNVDITRLTASPPKDKPLGAVTYSFSSYTVVITGSIEDILKFVQALKTGDGFELPWSAEVKSININVAESQATINLDIYAYKR